MRVFEQRVNRGWCNRGGIPLEQTSGANKPSLCVHVGAIDGGYIQSVTSGDPGCVEVCGGPSPGRIAAAGGRHRCEALSQLGQDEPASG